jgi:hypothetical protein
VTYATADRHLREGKSVRRAAWIIGHRLELRDHVFTLITADYRVAPSQWVPTAADLLASDWEIA